AAADAILAPWRSTSVSYPERIEAFRRAREVPDHARSYLGLEALLDAGTCDAPILATPDAVHVKQLYRCAARGVHALVEKPLATARDAARSALELAQSCDTVV